MEKIMDGEWHEDPDVPTIGTVKGAFSTHAYNVQDIVSLVGDIGYVTTTYRFNHGDPWRFEWLILVGVLAKEVDIHIRKPEVK